MDKNILRSIIITGSITIFGLILFFVSRLEIEKTPLPAPPTDTIDFPDLTPVISGGTLSGEALPFADDIARATEAQKAEKERDEIERSVIMQVGSGADITLCETIMTEQNKNECQTIGALGAALTAKNPKVCNTYLSGADIEACRDQVYMSLAITSTGTDTGLSSCQNIRDPGSRNLCLKQVEKVSLIKTVSGTGIVSKKDCQKLTSTDNQTECNLIVTEKSDIKILSDAIRDENTSACAKLESHDLKEKCEDALVFKKAKQENNISLCGTIKDEAAKLKCNNDLTLITDRKTYQEALSTSNKNLCDSIKSVSLKNQCIDRFLYTDIQSSGDASQCARLTDVRKQKSCQDALMLKNPQ